MFDFISPMLAPMLGQAIAQGLTQLLGDGLFAVGIPWLLMLLERTERFPALTQHSSRIRKICAAVVGALTAAGIKSSLDIGAGTFVISGITTTGLGLFAAEVVKQLSLQELAYQWLFDKKK